MMITGYEAFGIFQALKLHFTSDSYDFFKYNGKSKVSVDAFENRKDKYHFYKLSRRLSNRDELIMFIVANFVQNENIWVGDLLTEESETIYRQRQKVIQSLSYIFENDCRKLFDNIDNPNEFLKVTNGEYPVLMTKTLQRDIEIETLCIMNKILGFMPNWNNKIEDTIRWPLFYRKVIKFSEFLPKDVSKFKFILKKVIDENQKIIS
jgi:tetrahydromethanopterin S-methyltransferase subunit G